MKYPNEEIKIKVVDEEKQKREETPIINHEFKDTKDGLGPFYEMVLFGAAIE